MLRLEPLTVPLRSTYYITRSYVPTGFYSSIDVHAPRPVVIGRPKRDRAQIKRRRKQKHAAR